MARVRRAAFPRRTPFANALRHQPAQRPLVPVPLADDADAKGRGEPLDLEVSGRALHLVEHGEHMRDQNSAQPLTGVGHRPAGLGDALEHAIQRPVLAVEQDLVLALEVVVEVGGRQVGRHRDVAHAGAREAALAEDRRGRAQDGVAARIEAAGARGEDGRSGRGPFEPRFDFRTIVRTSYLVAGRSR